MSKFKLIDDMSNDEYHAQKEEGLHHYSSTQMKTMLEDPEVFYKSYITKEIPHKTSTAFDVGTYVHTAILQPELLEKECIVYNLSKTRSGKKWDEFKELHKDKVILTESDAAKAQMCIDAVADSPIAQELLSEGVAEQSLFVELCGVKVKVRFDWLNSKLGYILDVKTTTGSVKNEYEIRTKISRFQYEMSAAIYMDAANAYYKSIGISNRIKTFYWTFASKDQGTSKTYAASDDSIAIGRAKYQKALHLIKLYQDRKWEFIDEVTVLEPQPHEREWLIKPKKLVETTTKEANASDIF